jgi:hypothetical protein
MVRAMRYMIYEKEFGLFLGTVDRYAIFSNNNLFGFTKIYTFKNKEVADEYIDRLLGRDRGKWKLIEINWDNEFVDAVDLFRLGYGDYAAGILENMESPSAALH